MARAQYLKLSGQYLRRIMGTATLRWKDSPKIVRKKKGLLD